MTEPTLIKEQNTRFQAFLLGTIEHFRRGEDASGMKYFLSSIEELEKLITLDQESDESKIDLDQLLPAMRGLYFYMQNQDITGIADLLEYTVYPLSQEWFEGHEEK